jgi:hypothetical protein
MADWKNWTEQFRSERYKKTTTGVKPGGMPVIEVDPSNAYAASDGRGMQLSFYHLPSQDAVYFKAFITAYNETFNSDWGAETVYGRTDPIYMFKNTRRQISLAFKVPAFSEGEAYENLGRVQKLTQYLYPSYTDTPGGKIISQSPLVRLKVMNLAHTQASKIFSDQAAQDFLASVHRAKAQNKAAAELYESYNTSGNANRGLLGVIASVQINHNLEEQGVLEKATGTILPKLIDVAVTFDVIHEHTLGWDAQGNSLDPAFPYNVILEEPYSPDWSEATTYDQRVAQTQAEQQDRDLRQQQIDNAEARYSGMFGTSGPFGIGRGRLGSDLRALKKGLGKDRALNPYEESALRGNYSEEEWGEIERLAGLGATTTSDGYAGKK